MCVHEIPHQWISMDLIDLPCIFLILLGLAISIYYRHVYGWVIRNIGISMKPSMKPSMKLPMKSHEAMDQQRSISCTQLHSAALSCTQLHSAALSCTQLPAFCKNGARFAAYTICEYFFVAFFLRGTPGPRWSEMIWGISTTKPCLPYVFDDFLKKHWIFKGYNNMIYNDWTTGNMNSVSFTKTLENFDMESQKLGFRAVSYWKRQFLRYRCQVYWGRVFTTGLCFGNKHVTCLP